METKKTKPILPSADASLANENPPAPPPEAPPAPPGDKPGDAAPEKLTPLEWARKKGLLVEPTPEKPWIQEPYATGFHAEAEQLHGWKWHAHHFQTPAQAFRLTEQDYDAALKAAAEFPAKPAHDAAIPEGFPKPEVPKHIAAACAAAQAKAAEKKG